MTFITPPHREHEFEMKKNKSFLKKRWSELSRGDMFFLGMLFGWLTLAILIAIGA